MSNNHFSPNAISYKELNALLSQAKKEILSFESSEKNKINENQEFSKLVEDWKNTSKKILQILNTKDKVSTKIAFGVMAAHINMALQALKATKFDQ